MNMVMCDLLRLLCIDLFELFIQFPFSLSHCKFVFECIKLYSKIRDLICVLDAFDYTFSNWDDGICR